MANDNHSLVQLLHRLGLSQQEAIMYQALLELESVSIRKAAERSGINRGTAYETIKRLVTRGLVSARQSGQREYYTAEPPDYIFTLIQEQRKELWRSQQAAKEIVPRLLAQSSRPQGRPLVRYYEDDDGIVTVLKDVLQTCAKLPHSIYFAYSSRPLRQYLYRQFPQYTQRRVNEGIAVKVIAIGEGGDPAASSERKWLPEPNGSSVSSYVIIYGDKVASISISTDYTPYAVVTEDSGMASMQRLLFEQLWQTL